MFGEKLVPYQQKSSDPTIPKGVSAPQNSAFSLRQQFWDPVIAKEHWVAFLLTPKPSSALKFPGDPIPPPNHVSDPSQL